VSESSSLRHIVMFQFKENTVPSEIDEVIRRFAELQHSIPGIKAFEWGLNNSPEGLNEGLTHCFFLTFTSAAERDAYLPHPLHVAFADWVNPWIAKVVVFDYST